MSFLLVSLQSERASLRKKEAPQTELVEPAQTLESVYQVSMPRLPKGTPKAARGKSGLTPGRLDSQVGHGVKTEVEKASEPECLSTDWGKMV